MYFEILWNTNASMQVYDVWSSEPVTANESTGDRRQCILRQSCLPCVKATNIRGVRALLD